MKGSKACDGKMPMPMKKGMKKNPFASKSMKGGH